MTTSKIIKEMMSVAPPGQREITYDAHEQLHQLTGLLLEADAESASAEYENFVSIRQRELDLSLIRDELRATYQGQRILVTGGTGCIGSVLIRQLTLCEPSDIYVLYNGDNAFDPMPGVVYLDVDIRDEQATMDAFLSVMPDVVFHCAAQRSPMLAEHEIARTVLTNVVGTRNVLRAARAADVSRFIHTSTGKAMRYYTTDIYAASKKIAEWLVQAYAAEGRVTGLGRFTHVVDNAVVLENVQKQMDELHGLVRCHGADIEFYVQSAIESAQLLLVAGLNREPGLRAVAIRCLGEPAKLLPMLLGKLLSGSSSFPPIYFSGYDKGYEKGNPPGLYDPITAADLSPLINAVEAASATEVEGAPQVDRFRLSLPTDNLVELVVDRLQYVCQTGSELEIATALAEAGKTQAEAMFALCPEPLFYRLNRMATRGGVALPCSRKAFK